MQRNYHLPWDRPFGYRLLDMGGDGDCAFRAIGAAMVRMTGIPISPYKGKRYGNHAKLNMAMWAGEQLAGLGDGDWWARTWRAPSHATSAMEAGEPAPTTAREWLEALRRQCRSQSSSSTNRRLGWMPQSLGKGDGSAVRPRTIVGWFFM